MKIFCGVDVSKARLDACIQPGGMFQSFDNDAAGIAALAGFCREHAVQLVVMEASGGYERQAFLLLWEAGIPCALTNPRSVRCYAEAMGILEKTDRLDASVIARFAIAKDIKPTPLPSPQQRRLKALVARLRQVTEDLTIDGGGASLLLDSEIVSHLSQPRDQGFQPALLRARQGRRLDVFGDREVSNHLGIEPVGLLQNAHRLGISSELNRDLSLALGTADVTLMELTAAYAAFASGGQGAWPYAIVEVRDKSGTVLYRRQGSGPGEVIQPGIAGEMNQLLAGVIDHGTGKAAQIGRPVAGKTGTTQDYRDAWFEGFTADLVTGVWFGNDDNTPMNNVTGGTLPARTWHDFMAEATKGQAVRPVS